MTTAITISSQELGETFTFTMPSGGGYVRVSDGKGDYRQIFRDTGGAVTAHSEDDLHKVGRWFIRRAVKGNPAHG